MKYNLWLIHTKSLNCCNDSLTKQQNYLCHHVCHKNAACVQLICYWHLVVTHKTYIWSYWIVHSK